MSPGLAIAAAAAVFSICWLFCVCCHFFVDHRSAFISLVSLSAALCNSEALSFLLRHNSQAEEAQQGKEEPEEYYCVINRNNGLPAMPGTSPLVSQNHIIKIAQPLSSQHYSITLSWLIRKSADRAKPFEIFIVMFSGTSDRKDTNFLKDIYIELLLCAKQVQKPQKQSLQEEENKKGGDDAVSRFIGPQIRFWCWGGPSEKWQQRGYWQLQVAPLLCQNGAVSSSMLFSSLLMWYITLRNT